MRFLSLTTAQTMALVLASVGLVVASYLLKLRHRRVFLSSSLVWRRVLDDRQQHSLWDSLRKVVSIVIAATIALLIALSVARPEIESLTGKNERIIIVLDTSPTMNTRASDGRTRWQHAMIEASSLIDSGGPTTEFQIVATSGATSAALTTDRAEAKNFLAQISPTNGEPHFPTIEEVNSRVFFISDGVAVRNVPASVRRISVFEAAENAGITAFEIRSIPSSPLAYEAYVEVQNFGRQVNEVGLTISGAGGQRVQKAVRLAPGESLKDIVDLSKFAGGGVRAIIQSRNDSLEMDDVAYAYLPIKRKTRTLLVTRKPGYLATLLGLDNYVDLVVTDPTRYREAPDIDVYVFDQFAPPQPPPRPALVIGTPAAPWLRTANGVVQKPQITNWAEEHPVMQYVPVHDLSIERAARIDPGNLTVVAESNQIPLIVVSEKPQWVLLTFDLDSSDFPFHVGFPVFIENVLSWFNRDGLAMRRSPGTVRLSLANAQIQSIDGQPVPSAQQLGGTVFEARQPGLYTANQGSARVHIAVNLTNRVFSDVNSSIFRGENAGASETFLLRRELWFYLLLGALVLISVEWFTYHRRITL